MKLLLRLAWRNVWRHRSRTLIVVLAVGLCGLLTMAFQGMVGGMNQATYGNALKVMGGNIHVHALGYNAHPDEYPMLPLEGDQTQGIVDSAQALPEVLAATRRVNTGGMLSNRKGAFAIGIAGIEPKAELPVSLVGQNVTQGRYLTSEDRDAVLIGKGLASAMQAKVGDRISLAGRGTHNQMRTRTMTVVGIYELGLDEIEKQVIYMSLLEAQSLYLGPGQSTEVVIWLENLDTQAAVMRALAPQAAAYEVTSWKVKFPELNQTMAIADLEVQIIALSILGIAGIGILNLMLMAVYERTREIGVLAALGLKPAQISWLFLIEGALLGVVGAVAGVLAGIAFNATIGSIGLSLPGYSQLGGFAALMPERIYSVLALDKAPQFILLSAVISVVASYIPARQAASREPATALHYV